MHVVAAVSVSLTHSSAFVCMAASDRESDQGYERDEPSSHWSPFSNHAVWAARGAQEPIVGLTDNQYLMG